MPIIHRESPWLRNGADIYYNNGNAGIGTTVPLMKLHVRPANAITGITANADASILVEGGITTDATSGRAIIQLTSASARHAGIYFGDADDNDIGRIYYHNNDDSMYFVVSTTTAMTIQSDADVIVNSGNVGIGTTDQFGGAAGALALGNAGTVPSSNPTDAIIMYSADIAAGQAAPHFRCEAGWVIKLYQQALIADPTGGATVDAEARTAINAILDLLAGNGLMAAA